MPKVYTSAENSMSAGKLYGSGLTNSPKYQTYTESFIQKVKDIDNVAKSNLFLDPYRTMQDPSAIATLREFFIKDAVMKNDPLYGNDPVAIKEEQEMLKVLFNNDIKAVFNESTNMANINPIIGMTTPIHKSIMLNMAFEQGGIQKAVTDSPRYTITMEYRYLVDTKGNRLDFVLDQNKLTDAINATSPMREIEVTLPERGTTDFVKLLGGTGIDHLSTVTNIYAVKVANVMIEEGDRLPDENGYITNRSKIATSSDVGPKDVWYRVDIRFTPAYGTEARIAYKEINIKHKAQNSGNTEIVETTDYISAQMDNDKLIITASFGNITDVRVQTKLTTSNLNMATCHTEWSQKTTFEEIPDAPPISTTISPDELRDIKSLYKVDQVARVVENTKSVTHNYKDDMIHRGLDDSYDTIADPNAKKFGVFDFNPREQYADNQYEWIKGTFIKWLESYTTHMLQVLNDSNMTITVYGDPDIVRRISPSDCQYTAPSTVAAVPLDFIKHVYTTDNRLYEFIGSDKLRGSDELIVVLNPRNSDRIVYRIVDYMYFISNEIRNAENPSLPAITSYERWQFLSYQPVQGRVKILNPSGIKDDPDAEYYANGHNAK